MKKLYLLAHSLLLLSLCMQPALAQPARPNSIVVNLTGGEAANNFTLPASMTVPSTSLSGPLTSFSGSNNKMERGSPLYSTEVESGATYYAISGMAQGFPQRMNGPFINRTGGSSFLAIKEDEDGNKKIWLNISVGAWRILAGSGIIMDWEYQFRYFKDTKTSEEKLTLGTVPNGNFYAGQPVTGTVELKYEDEIINEKDKLALLDIKSKLTGLGWVDPNDMKNWPGLKFKWEDKDGKKVGYVTDINLANLGVTGILPSSVGNFEKLENLVLNNNQLQGAIPAAVTQLANLKTLFIQNNRLTGLPDLSTMAALVSVKCENNKFTFEDLETNTQKQFSISYNPQAKIEGEKDSLWFKEGEDHTIELQLLLGELSAIGGKNNKYHWSYNGLKMYGRGVNDKDLKFTDISTDESGEYTCEITNTLVPDLIFTSIPVVLQVTGPIKSVISDVSVSTITGQITRKPLAGAKVKLIRDGSTIDTKTSDNEGKVELEFKKLEKGQTLKISAFKIQQDVEYEAIHKDIKPTQEVIKIDLPLTLQQRIYDTVSRMENLSFTWKAFGTDFYTQTIDGYNINGLMSLFGNDRWLKSEENHEKVRESMARTLLAIQTAADYYEESGTLAGKCGESIAEAFLFGWSLIGDLNKAIIDEEDAYRKLKDEEIENPFTTKKIAQYVYGWIKDDLKKKILSSISDASARRAVAITLEQLEIQIFEDKKTEEFIKSRIKEIIGNGLALAYQKGYYISNSQEFIDRAHTSALNNTHEGEFEGVARRSFSLLNASRQRNLDAVNKGEFAQETADDWKKYVFDFPGAKLIGVFTATVGGSILGAQGAGVYFYNSRYFDLLDDLDNHYNAIYAQSQIADVKIQPANGSEVAELDDLLKRYNDSLILLKPFIITGDFKKVINASASLTSLEQKIESGIKEIRNRFYAASSVQEQLDGFNDVYLPVLAALDYNTSKKIAYNYGLLEYFINSEKGSNRVLLTQAIDSLVHSNNKLKGISKKLAVTAGVTIPATILSTAVEQPDTIKFNADFKVTVRYKNFGTVTSMPFDIITDAAGGLSVQQDSVRVGALGAGEERTIVFNVQAKDISNNPYLNVYFKADNPFSESIIFKVNAVIVTKNTKQDQTITFAPIPDKTTTDTAFDLTATASSGLPVSFTLATEPAEGVAQLTGNRVTLLGDTGTVTVTASQAGNASYKPAADVPRTFRVNPSVPEDITPPVLMGRSPADGAIEVAVNARLEMDFSEKIKKGEGKITINAGGDIREVEVSSSAVSVAGGEVTIATEPFEEATLVSIAVEAGAFTDEAGNAFAGFSSTAWQFTTRTPDPEKQNQTIAFQPIADKTYGDAPFAVTAAASSGLPVTFSIGSGPATVSGSTVTITGAGPVTVRALQAGNDTYHPASEDQTFTVQKGTPVVTWNTPAAVSAGTPLGAAQLNATASVAGTFRYSPAAGTILAAGVHTLTVDFMPGDSANYRPVAGTKVQLTVTPLTNPCADGPCPWRLNAGGDSLLTADGRQFQPDAYHKGGRLTRYAPADVANVVDDELYRTGRYGYVFSYNVPTGNGRFDVILHFNESYWGNLATGDEQSRTFNVDIEEKRKLTGFNVFAQAGGAMKAVQRSFRVDVTDGALDIKFGKDTADLARVSGIEILPAGGGYRVNAGGLTLLDAQKQQFLPDSYHRGGVHSQYAAGEVANATEDEIYRSGRHGTSFSYNFPVANGQYNVVLHFNETFWGNLIPGGVGSRRFNVAIEGQPKLADYDIYAKAGGAMKAIRENISVNVSDGVLNIRFTKGSADLPRVSAIEIIPVTASARVAAAGTAAEDGSAMGVELYPNPAGNTLSVKLNVAGREVAATAIMDLAGRTQLQNSHKLAGEKELLFNVSSLKAGFYLLRLQTGSGYRVVKFVKQ